MLLLGIMQICGLERVKYGTSCGLSTNYPSMAMLSRHSSKTIMKQFLQYTMLCLIIDYCYPLIHSYVLLNDFVS